MSVRSHVSDWRIVLWPRAVDTDGRGGTLEVLAGDEEDAVEALEGWAETIERLGFVPDGLEWRNRTPAAVRGRQGKLSYRVRVDSFEHETATGYDEGHGWLRAIEVPS